MTISNEAVEAAAKFLVGDNPFNDEDGLWEVPSIRDHYLAVARGALEAAAPIIRAECLEETADALSQPRTLWFGDQGVTVAEPPGLPTATLDEWLRARAVAERGRQ